MFYFQLRKHGSLYLFGDVARGVGMVELHTSDLIPGHIVEVLHRPPTWSIHKLLDTCILVVSKLLRILGDQTGHLCVFPTLLELGLLVYIMLVGCETVGGVENSRRLECWLGRALESLLLC